MGIHVEIVWADGRHEVIDSHLDTLEGVHDLWVTTFKAAHAGFTLDGEARLPAVAEEKYMFRRRWDRRGTLSTGFYEVSQ